MSRDSNFLLGRGELLSSPVTVKSRGGPKNTPYNLAEARYRLNNWLDVAEQDFCLMQEDARPKNQVVATLTMHPRYISKSDFPSDLFKAVGLRAVGSKTQNITPEKWGIQKHPDSALTETYFVAGTLESFEQWNKGLNSFSLNNSAESAIMHIEDLKAFRGSDKLKNIKNITDEAVFEFVIHNDHDPEILELFIEYARRHDGKPILNKCRSIRGLSFLPIKASASVLEDLADFAFVRAARGMPALRPYRPLFLRRSSGFHIDLPENTSLSKDFKVAIFDGGLPSPNIFEKWVTYIEPQGIGAAVPNYVDHGLAVTSSLLFGHILPNEILNQPFSNIDHIRVLDEKTGHDDCDIIDVLDRIKEHLSSNDYDFINISLGPDSCVEDDDVTLWTSSIDELLSHGKTVATVAAGNNGEQDSASGLNRVQVPADAVNVLSVGATDSLGSTWQRASYSAIGPGRCPGRVKPDIVAFGGSDSEPFNVVSSLNRTTEQTGTSFAAPLALRAAVAVRSMLGSDLSALALRALLIHRAEPSSYGMKEVGWGRTEESPIKLITSEDNEAIVIYQGDLLVGQHLRIPVPLNGIQLSGSIEISATLVISPDIDPEYPGSYTRSGVEVFFRPHDEIFSMNEGKKSQHPKTATFFTESNIFGKSEYESRDDGHKWEPAIRYKHSFKSNKLSNPVFDVYYHHRHAAAKPADQKPIPYALIVGVKAVEMVDLYNQMVRAYASILTPIRPINRLQIKP